MYTKEAWESGASPSGPLAALRLAYKASGSASPLPGILHVKKNAGVWESAFPLNFYILGVINCLHPVTSKPRTPCQCGRHEHTTDKVHPAAPLRNK